MRINGHSHIFTLQSVLSKEAISIMVGRLRRLLMRDFIIEAVERLLEEQLDHPEYLIEDELLVRFMRQIGKSTGFKQLISTHSLPVEVQLLGSSGGKLEVRLMRAALDRLSSWIDANDGPGKNPFDVFETLRIALSPDIPRVADRLLSHLGPDDALVALMMDIVADREPARDRLNFQSQIRGTMDAMIRHPGRVLPFIAVNPRRPDHFALMRRAIEEQGFAGVKLYPSLGFELTTPAMRSVLAYCRQEEVPIVVHATAGGFSRDADSADYAHPRHWQSLLETNDPLRICYAHCGGWGGFCMQDGDQIEWAETILAYMAEQPNVYADLSYHVEMMLKGEEIERCYFTALKALLHGDLGGRIIFGTDSWLLRLNIDDAAYWRYFESKLTKAEFAQIAEQAPARFLGLPAAGRPAARNIQRHIAFLEANSDRVGSDPASWLRTASSAHWAVIRRDLRWNRNNKAHVATFNYFNSQIPPRLRGTGFDDAGSLRLRQLDYFGRGQPSDTKVRGNARNIMANMIAYGGTPEGSYDDPTIHAKLIELLGDGDRSLAELAGSVDAMYRFASEVV